MRAGRWGAGDGVQPVAVSARISGAGIRARVTADCVHSIFDAHPAHPSDSPASSASLTIHPEVDVTGQVPDPLSRPAGWPPRKGAAVAVDVGDGTQWWQQLTGTVSSLDGSWTDPALGMEVVDRLESLRRMISSGSAGSILSDAVLAWQPPLTRVSSTAWRHIGMCSTWLLDRAARVAGYYATAPLRWGTSLSVPMMGSLAPDRGTVLSAVGRGTSDGLPEQVIAPWGMAMRRFDATYEPVWPIALPLEVVVDLPVREPGQSWARVHLGDLDYASGYVLTYRHDTDLVQIGTSTDGGETVSNLITLQRGGADRVAARITASTVALRRSIDAAETTVNHSAPSGFTVDRVRAWGDPALGGFTLDSDQAAPWSTVAAARTARIRVHPSMMGRWSVAPHTHGMTSRDVIEAIASAECAAWWINGDVLEYAGPRVLDEQPIAAEITSDESLVAVAWRSERGTTARTVRTRYESPAVNRRRDQSIEVWTGGSSALQEGDVWEEWATPPEDEDWLGVADGITKVGPSTTWAQMRVGNVAAMESGLLADHTSSAWDILTGAALERVTQRAYKIIAVPWASPTHVVSVRWPENLGASRNFPASWEGKDGINLRAFARITWAEQHTPARATTASSSDVLEHVHDTGRWVQSGPQRAALETWIAEQLGLDYPALTEIRVRPDPRIEQGDRVTLRDKERTGISCDVVVQSIRSAWRDGDASMVLTGRITGWSVDQSVRDRNAPPLPHWLQQQAHGSLTA